MAFVREPAAEFARRLRAAPGKDIWMMGGGGLIGSFLDAGHIDEFRIHVIPTLIGEGIPLVAPRHRDLGVQLARDVVPSTKWIREGIERHVAWLDRIATRGRRYLGTEAT